MIRTRRRADRHVGRARRRALCAVTALAMLCATPAVAQRPGVGEGPLGLGASPIGDKVKVRVGSVERFRVEALGTDVRHRWTLDGRVVGSAAQWSFAPAAADVGLHRVLVTVTAREGTVSRAWSVRVLPPRPPVLTDVSPRETTLTVPARTWLRFRVRATPGAPLEQIAITWSVDGAAVSDGETLRWRPPEPGSYRVRALATSTLGSAVAREWRVDATVPTTTSTEPPVATTTSTNAPSPTTTITAPPPTTTTTTTTTEPPPVATTTTTAPPSPPPTTTPPPAGGPSDAEVRAFLDRYAAAWGRGDVDELGRLGQVTNDKQADALRAYFARTGPIAVAIEQLVIERDGDRIVVRFHRRDRFRNPAGGQVDEQSPPLEKEIVEGPGGLRFGRSR